MPVIFMVKVFIDGFLFDFYISHRDGEAMHGPLKYSGLHEDLPASGQRLLCDMEQCEILGHLSERRVEG